MKVSEINVIPGYLCNMSCSHCVNNSGPDRNDSDISEDEIRRIIEEINLVRPPKIVFTGGEPTLYIESLNRILRRLDYKPKVLLTTNGKFARTIDAALSVINKFEYLSKVQMSFDKYHNADDLQVQLTNLNEACKQKAIEFQIVTTISNPMELVEIGELIGPNIKVVFQPSINGGRASALGVGYSYPKFDSTVLNKKCPNLGSISYIPKKGFSTCCSSLAFRNVDGVTGSTVESHFKSRFYHLIEKFTFGEILRKTEISENELTSMHSNPCNLCSHIFQKGICNGI